MSPRGKANEITISRIYDAPVKQVWEAWTDKEQAAKWWGPRGFTITTHHSDIRPGGSWHYTMHGPDGVDYENKTQYYEVEKYRKMVYDHGGGDDRPPLFRVTVTFEEKRGKTHLEMTMALATAEAAAETRKFIKKANGDSTWDRLAEYLSPVDRFVINRSFEAPIETVFEMWSDPKHIAQWLSPTGTTMEYFRADVKEGGSSFYRMSGPSGELYGRAQYRQIRRPDLLVYTQCFCDKNEKVIRHPMAPTWPESMLTTIQLTSEGPNQTRVTITWEVHGEATDVERKTFHDAKSGMTQGWTGSLDKLEEALKSRS